MNGAIFLPSFNRPKLLKQFLKSYRDTRATTPIWVVLDKQDPAKEEYLQIQLPPGSRFILTEARDMGGKANEIWDQLIALDFVMVLNDDYYAVTQKWDLRVISALSPSGVVGTNDNFNAPRRLAGCIALSHGFLKATGWLFPPGIKHLYTDSAWEYLCGKASCAQILMDVVVEHRHAYLDKSREDDTFKLINGEGGLVNGEGTGGYWPDDKRAFEEWLRTDAEAAVSRVMAIQPKSGLMIAVPSQHGDVNLDWAMGVLELGVHLSSQGIYYEVARVVGSSLLAHARNTLVDMFLKSRCQKLVFIDSDQGFTKDTVLNLYNSKTKIIAAIVPHKRFPMNLNFEPLNEDMKFFKDLVNKSSQELWALAKAKASPQGEIKVKRAGTGMMCIDRSAFEAMKPYTPIYLAYDFRTDAVHHEFFRMGINPATTRYVGEDWGFALIAQKAGIPMYINANALCSHKGNFSWQIEPPKQ